MKGSMVRSLAMALAGVSLAGLAGPLAAAAQAQDAQRRAFDIPAQDMAGALETFGRQSGRDILFDRDQVAGRRSTGVRGTLEPADALRRLIGGTQLSISAPNGGTFVIGRSVAGSPYSGEDQAGGTAADSESADESAIGISEILVTGRRTLNVDVRRTENDAQPYVVFNQDSIRRSGAQNLETFLRDQLPMNAGGNPNSLRVTTLGAQSRVNLRGLGTGQTLILINGRRTTPGPAIASTPQQPDLNGIPLAAIERIEVLPATASGIYGGGATGGVINVILRQDYAGAEIRASYGGTVDGEAAERRIDLSLGFNIGARTNILLTGSYSDQGPLFLGDRASLVRRYYDVVRANAPGLLLPPNNPPLGSTPNIRSVTGANLVLDNGTALNSPITYLPAGYSGATAGGIQSLIANAGQYSLDLADGTQFITGSRIQILQDPSEMSARLSLQHEFSPRVRAFLEANASENHANGVTTSTIGTFLAPFRIAGSAPNNPFTTDILVTVPTDSFDEAIETTITQYRATAGLIVALPHRWQAAADYTWGRTIFSTGGVQQRANTAFAPAILNGTLDVLRDTRVNPVDLSPYLVATPLTGRRPTNLQVAALRLGGPAIALPAGPIALSSLLEYRQENFGEATQTGPGTALFYPSRSQSATSFYLEAQVPLFSEQNRRPGIESLDLQLALRADQYGTRGATGFITVGSGAAIERTRNEASSVNPTVALRYRPIADLTLRASFGTGFVPPDVSQLASTIYPATLAVADPKRGGTQTTLSIGQVLYLGNPNLTPEKSESWSAGLILTPRFAPGLRLSLDYTRISKTNNITTYPTSFQGLINDEGLFPDRIRRGANLPGDQPGWAGPINFLDFTYFNIARSIVEALDVQVDYSRETRIGTFTLSSVATWQLRYDTIALQGQPVIENVGIGYSNPLSFVGNAELRWEHRGWTVGWLARHYSSYLTVDPAPASSVAAITLQGNGGRVPSQTYHDLFVNWAPDRSGANIPGLLRGTELQLSIRNIFDKLPPFDASFFNSFRTFHSPVGDPRGAVYQISLTKRF